MSLRLFERLLLNPEFYDSWKREIQLWRLASNISPSRQAPAFLSLTGQARTAILEMDISLLNAEDGMDKLVEKLDTPFPGRQKPVCVYLLRKLQELPPGM